MKKMTIMTWAALALGAASGCGAFAQVTAPAAPAIPAVAAPAATDAAATPAMMSKKAKKPKRTMKPKGMPKTPVTVENNSGLGLVELDAVLVGQQNSVKLAGPLESGKKIKVVVAHDKACLFDIHASYDDGSTGDATGLDLCKAKSINLTP